MPVVVGVLKETAANETRVALTPEIAGKLKGLGARVLVERGAGTAAHFTDKALRRRGVDRRSHDSVERRCPAVRAASHDRNRQ